METKVKTTQMGTIEPIYKKENENINSAFIRGVITKYRNSDVDVNEIFDYILNQLDEEIKGIEELKEFTIWLTGCGYDFTKRACFIKQRDKLLKN